MIRKFLAVGAFLLCAAAFASAAEFNFEYNGNNFDSIIGTFVTTTQGSGEFLITEITFGTMNGAPISSLLPPGAFDSNNNVLFVPANPGYLNATGFAFVVANNPFRLYYDANTPGGYSLSSQSGIQDMGGSLIVQPAAGSPAPVPEPGGILLVGTGLLGAAGAMWRKRKASAKTRETELF